MFLIKYNVIYAHSVINNFELVLQGPGQEIKLESSGVDFFTSALNALGDTAVMGVSLRVVGKLLSQHPELPMGPKTGYLILGTGGTFVSYKIIKSIANLGVGGSPVVSTSISLQNTDLPVNLSKNPVFINNADKFDKLSGLKENLFSVDKIVTNKTVDTL
jgi:hypothetical protein